MIAVDCSAVTGVGGAATATVNCSEALTKTVEELGLTRDPDFQEVACWQIEDSAGLHRSVIRSRDETGVILLLGDAKTDVFPHITSSEFENMVQALLETAKGSCGECEIRTGVTSQERHELFSRQPMLNPIQENDEVVASTENQ